MMFFKTYFVEGGNTVSKMPYIFTKQKVVYSDVQLN